MLAKLNELRRREDGFTLIELMVVVLIIGILAAIAIPVFLHLQKEGVKASIKSDVKNTVTTVATFLAANPDEEGFDEEIIEAAGFKITESSGNTVRVLGDWDGYTVVGRNIPALGSVYRYTFDSTFGTYTETPQP